MKNIKEVPQQDKYDVGGVGYESTAKPTSVMFDTNGGFPHPRPERTFNEGPLIRPSHTDGKAEENTEPGSMCFIGVIGRRF